MPRRIVIVGGGHAAAQLCASLARAPDVAVTLVSDEPALPYHRPPLSKTFPEEGDVPHAPIRPSAFYGDNGIEVLLSHRATGIDTSGHRVQLLAAQDASMECAYDELVIATGAQAREVPALPRGMRGVHYLRSLADAHRMLETVRGHPAGSVAVVGGGFIGLEAGSALAAQRFRVTVLEAGPRLLGRGGSPELAAWLLRTHTQAGIDIRVDCPVIDAHVLADGRIALQGPAGAVMADFVLVGAGSTPCTALASEAGLACSSAGIEVDEFLRTSDPHVSAIGDCTAFASADGSRMRLESVYNANEQAKTLAARLAGQPVAYRPSPWFWSDQGPLRLQMAGLHRPGLQTERIGQTQASIVLHHFDGDALVAVEAVNAPREYMQARRLIETANTA